MFNNKFMEIAFSDELHKIASSGSHDEAVDLLKSAAKSKILNMAKGLAGKTWRFGVRQGKDILRHPSVMIDKAKRVGSKILSKVPGKFSPLERLRMKGIMGEERAISNIAAKRKGFAQTQQAKATELVAKEQDKTKKLLRNTRSNTYKNIKSKTPHTQETMKENTRRISNVMTRNKMLEAESKAKDAADKYKNFGVSDYVGGALYRGDNAAVRKTIGAGALGGAGILAYKGVTGKDKKDVNVHKYGSFSFNGTSNNE